MKIGYIRVSAVDQNEQRQIKIMEDNNIEKLFIDKCSGKNINRPQLILLKEFIREGDWVYIESFSRLARSTRDLLGLVDYFKNRNVNLISFKENVDTSTPTGKLMLTMIGAIGEFERDCILERQMEGIKLAKLAGKYKGRKRIEFPFNWKDIYNQYKNRYITGTKAMELLGLKRNTFYRLKKEWEENIQIK